MVEYNGVKMELVNIDLLDQQQVESDDGSDALYLQVTLKVTTVVQAGYIYPDTGAVVSQQKLNDLLMAPRKTLVLSFDSSGEDQAVMPKNPELSFQNVSTGAFNYDGPYANEIAQLQVVPNTMDHGADTHATTKLINSPISGFSVDSKNGPMPLFCNIVKILGENGYVISWAVQTWINQCVGTTVSSSSPLLSNRFEMVHVVDADQLCTIHTSGIAMFRTDKLNINTWYPDQFRNMIMPPIYKRFRRDHIEVAQIADGTGIRYFVKDVELPVFFVTPNGADQPAGGAVANAVRCSVEKMNAIYSGDTITDSILATRDSYYGYRSQKAFADQGARDAELHSQRVKESRAATLASKRMAAYYKSRTPPKPKPKP